MRKLKTQEILSHPSALQSSYQPKANPWNPTQSQNEAHSGPTLIQPRLPKQHPRWKGEPREHHQPKRELKDILQIHYRQGRPKITDSPTPNLSNMLPNAIRLLRTPESTKKKAYRKNPKGTQSKIHVGCQPKHIIRDNATNQVAGTEVLSQHRSPIPKKYQEVRVALAKAVSMHHTRWIG